MTVTPSLKEGIDVDMGGEDRSHHDLNVQRKGNKKAQDPKWDFYVLSERSLRVKRQKRPMVACGAK